MLKLRTSQFFYDSTHCTLSQELSSLELWGFPDEMEITSSATGRVVDYRLYSKSYGGGMATYVAAESGLPKLLLFND